MPEEVFMKTIVLFTLVSLGGALLQAQSATDPLSGGIRGIYNISRSNVVRAAEKMPEENYSFKPSPDVRSFGQIIGHIADAQYQFCSVALGETNPAPGIEKSKTSKADLVKALNDALTYCDKAYSAMTDAHAADMVKFFGRDQPKLAILAFNSAHNMEHYGNLVTYMRIKGLVPPSSEPRK
jgi:uncharacterized damage-inducible protein DinB